MKDKIRVLHVVVRMDRAGLETFIMNVYRNIDRNMFEFNFLCASSLEGAYDDEIMQLGGKIYHMPMSDKRGILKKFDRVNLIAQWLITHKNEIDIIHWHSGDAVESLLCLKACKKAGIKNIIIHSHNSKCDRMILNRICRVFAGAYKYRKLACSEEAAKWRFGNRFVKKNEVEVIYNGIDLEAYRYDKQLSVNMKKSFGVENKIVIGHIGRFNQQKNHDFLIDIFYEYHKTHSDAVLILIGKGELEKAIRSKVSRLGLDNDVKFFGVRDDIPKILQAMDVFVFPSLYEGLGIVLIEAQAASLPVVTNKAIPKIAIVSDLVRMLPIDNPSRWCREIDEALRMDRSNAVFNDGLDKFDIKAVAKRLQEIYVQMEENN